MCSLVPGLRPPESLRSSWSRYGQRGEVVLLCALQPPGGQTKEHLRMDQTKLTIIRAVRDMARTDGRLHRQERKVLRLIADAEQLDPQEREYLQRTSEPLPVEEIGGLLTEKTDRLRLMELSVLVSMADGVESPDELDRLRQLASHLSLSNEDIHGCLERARERFFEITRMWDREA